jgi:hypothetical protein
LVQSGFLLLVLKVCIHLAAAFPAFSVFPALWNLFHHLLQVDLLGRVVAPLPSQSLDAFQATASAFVLLLLSGIECGDLYFRKLGFPSLWLLLLGWRRRRSFFPCGFGSLRIEVSLFNILLGVIHLLNGDFICFFTHFALLHFLARLLFFLDVVTEFKIV